jgi:hypothetical protein
MRVLWNNLADATATTGTASSSATGFPIANLKTIWPKFYHRTASLGTPDYWAWDLGGATSIYYAILWNHNFTSAATVKLQADNHSNFGSLDHDITLTYGTHWNDDILVYTFSTPSTACRYWRIISTDAGNTDGYLRAGRAYLGGYFQPKWSFARRAPSFVDPSIINFSSGGSMSAIKRDVYEAINYDVSMITEADEQTWKTAFQTIGKSSPYFLIENPTLPLTRTKYVRNSNDLLFSPVTDGHFSHVLSVEEMR